MALLAPLPGAFCPYGPSCSAAFGFGRPNGQCAPRCMSTIGEYGPSITAGFSYSRPHGPCGPRGLSVFRVHGPSCTSASSPPTGLQHSAYTALSAPQPLTPVDPMAHIASTACQLSVLGEPQPSTSADPVAPVTPVLVSFRPTRLHLTRSLRPRSGSIRPIRP